MTDVISRTSVIPSNINIEYQSGGYSMFKCENLIYIVIQSKKNWEIKKCLKCTFDKVSIWWILDIQYRISYGNVMLKLNRVILQLWYMC